MSGNEFRIRRVSHRIPGDRVARAASISRTRLCLFELQRLRPGAAELARLEDTLNELITKKQRAVTAAAEAGYPIA